MNGAEILAGLAHQRANVAVVRALRLGDLLCATPALRSLRAALPRARITLVGLPLAAEFVARCAALDVCEEFPGYPGIADQAVDPRRTVAFLRRMQEDRIDLAVQLHGSGVFSNPFTRLLGARYTVGFTREGETDLGPDFALTSRHPALSVLVPWRPCYYTECPIGYRCLDGVTVESVTRAAAALLCQARQERNTRRSGD